eukprot:3518562-Lingulodinium_polyedra.AAC.1
MANDLHCDLDRFMQHSGKNLLHHPAHEEDPEEQADLAMALAPTSAALASATAELAAAVAAYELGLSRARFAGASSATPR